MRVTSIRLRNAIWAMCVIELFWIDDPRDAMCLIYMIVTCEIMCIVSITVPHFAARKQKNTILRMHIALSSSFISISIGIRILFVKWNLKYAKVYLIISL